MGSGSSVPQLAQSESNESSRNPTFRDTQATTQRRPNSSESNHTNTSKNAGSPIPSAPSTPKRRVSLPPNQPDKESTRSAPTTPKSLSNSIERAPLSKSSSINSNRGRSITSPLSQSMTDITNQRKPALMVSASLPLLIHAHHRGSISATKSESSSTSNIPSLLLNQTQSLPASPKKGKRQIRDRVSSLRPPFALPAPFSPLSPILTPSSGLTDKSVFQNQIEASFSNLFSASMQGVASAFTALSESPIPPVVAQSGVLRVFLSSTFRDMQRERDHFFRYGASELKAHAKKFHLELVFIDLRWGLTGQESASGKVVIRCCESISNCPYFVCFLGARYGWIPRRNMPNEWDPSTETHFPFLKDILDKSVTEYEVHCAVFREKTTTYRAFFYFRDHDYTMKNASFPDEANLLSPGNEVEASRQEQLKRLIKAHFPVKTYQGHEHFVDLLVQDIQAQITTDFGEYEFPKSEDFYHSRLINSRLMSFEGRERIITDIMMQADQFSGKQINAPIVLMAESGFGKTSIMAALHQTLSLRNNTSVFGHFIGCSSASFYVDSFVERAASFLVMHSSVSDLGTLGDEQLQYVISKMSKTKRRKFFLIDGVDELLPSYSHPHPDQLGWVPIIAGSSLSIILSMSFSQRNIQTIEELGWNIVKIELLDEHEIHSIVLSYLSRYDKKLSDVQVQMISESSPARHPLYLRILLDELRQFGIYEHLSNEIEKCLSHLSAESLFQSILSKWEERYGYKLVQYALSILALSRIGLTENEMDDYLEESLGKDFIYEDWKSLLFVMSEVLYLCDGRLFYGHKVLQSSVKRKYCGDKRSLEFFMGTYARFLLKNFQSGATKKPQDVSEMCFSMKESSMPAELAEFLQKEDVIETLSNSRYRYDFLSYLHWLEDRGFNPMVLYNRFLMSNSALADSLFDLLIDSGYVSECKRILLKKVELLKNTENRILLYQQLGKTCLRMEDFASALMYHKLYLEHIEGLHGTVHPDAVVGYQEISKLYRRNKQYVEAIDASIRAIRMGSELWGQESPKLIESHIQMGLSKAELGRMEESLQELQQAVDISRISFGKQHPITSDAYAAISSVYLKYGKYAEYFSSMRKSYFIRADIFGSKNKISESTLTDISSFLEELRKIGSAELQDRTLVEFFESVDIADDTILQKMIDIYRVIFMHFVQSHEIQRATSLCEKILTNRHPEAANLSKKIGDFLIQQKDFDTAKSYYDDANEILDRCIYIQDSDIALMNKEIGDTYFSVNMHEEALEKYELAFGRASVQYAQMLIKIADFHFTKSRNIQRGIQFIDEARDIARATFGDSTFEFSRIMLIIGSSLLIAEPESSKGEESLQQALDIHHRIAPAHPIPFRDVCLEVAQILFTRNRHFKACKYFKLWFDNCNQFSLPDVFPLRQYAISSSIIRRHSQSLELYKLIHNIEPVVSTNAKEIYMFFREMAETSSFVEGFETARGYLEQGIRKLTDFGANTNSYICSLHTTIAEYYMKENRISESVQELEAAIIKIQGLKANRWNEQYYCLLKSAAATHSSIMSIEKAWSFYEKAEHLVRTYFNEPNNLLYSLWIEAFKQFFLVKSSRKMDECKEKLKGLHKNDTDLSLIISGVTNVHTWSYDSLQNGSDESSSPHKLILEAKEKLGDDNPKLVLMTKETAYNLMTSQKFEEADEFFHMSIAFAKKSIVNQSEISLMAKEIGDAFFENKQYHRGVRFYMLSVNENSENALKLLWKEGQSHLQLNNIERASQYLTEYCNLLSKEYGMQNPVFIKSCREVGTLFLSRQNFEKCLHFYKLAYGNHHVEIAKLYKSAGDIFFSQSKFELADDFYTTYLDIMAVAPSRFKHDLSPIIQPIIDGYFEKREYEKCVKFSEKLYGTSNPQLYIIFKRIGIRYLSEREFGKAGEVFKKAVEHLSIGVSGPSATLTQLYKEIGDAYFEIEWFDLADEYHLKYIRALRSLVHDESKIIDEIEDLANRYYHEKKFQKAYNYYINLIECEANRRGYSDSVVLDKMYHIGSLFLTARNFDAAQKMHCKYLEVLKMKINAENFSVDLSKIVWGLKDLYLDGGWIDEANRYFEEYVRIVESSSNLSKMDVSMIYKKMGDSCLESRRYDIAEDYYGKCIETFKKSCSNDHLLVANLYKDIGSSYVTKSWYEKADDYHRQGLWIMTIHMAENLADVAAFSKSIGDEYLSKGIFDKSDVYHKQALKNLGQCLGKSQPEYLELCISFASEYLKVKKYDISEGYFNEYVDLFRRKNSNNPEVLAPMYENLATMHLKHGWFAKADMYFERFLETHLQFSQSPAESMIYRSIGERFLKHQEYFFAQKYLDEQVNIMLQENPENNENIAQLLCSLGLACAEAKAFEKAKEYLRMSSEKYVDALGEDHEKTIDFWKTAGDCAIKFNVQEAASYYEKHLTSLSRIFGDKSLLLAESFIHAANQLSQMEEYETGLHYAEEGLLIYQSTLGTDDFQTLETEQQRNAILDSIAHADMRQRMRSQK